MSAAIAPESLDCAPAAALAFAVRVADEDQRERVNQLSYTIIGAAIRVHRSLGPGMKESAYEECLAVDLRTAGLLVARQKVLPIVYDGHQVNRAYRVDLIVEDAVAVEVKAVEALASVHRAQLRSYLIQSKLKLGLLLNFNVKWLRDGVHRVVNGFPD